MEALSLHGGDHGLGGLISAGPGRHLACAGHVDSHGLVAAFEVVSPEVVILERFRDVGSLGVHLLELGQVSLEINVLGPLDSEGVFDYFGLLQVDLGPNPLSDAFNEVIGGDLIRPVDVTGLEEFAGGEQSLPHAPYELHVDLFLVGDHVLPEALVEMDFALTAEIVGLKSALEFFQADFPRVVFIEDETKSGNLILSQFQTEVLDVLIEGCDGHRLGVSGVANSEEGFWC